MRTSKKTILLVVLGLLEVVFVSWVFAPILPRRVAEMDTFRVYQRAPTEENKKFWLKERQKTESEVRLRVSLGVCLAAGNLFLIGWLTRKHSTSFTSGDALGARDAPSKCDEPTRDPPTRI